MKHKSWLLAAGAIALGGLIVGTRARAADHLDAPAAMADPAADITDTYAWLDGTNAVLVLNVAPLGGALVFSDKVQYVLHTGSGTTFGNTTKSLDILCTFDAGQKISCWAGDQDYVTGDASPVAGLTSASGKMKVFAGVRSDSFFFNLSGFKDAVATVDAAEAGLTFDTSGCPKLDSATSTALVAMLQKTNMGKDPGADTFVAANVLSIVISIDKSLITAGGPIVSLWASTNKGI